MSPASDLSSPEHVHQKQPPPKPRAPETTAQPLNAFRPVPAPTGYGRFQGFPRYDVPRAPQQQQQSATTSTPLQPSVNIDFQPQQQPQPEQQPPAAHNEPEEDVEMERPSSPDPLDFLGQEEAEQDALIAEAFAALSVSSDMTVGSELASHRAVWGL